MTARLPELSYFFPAHNESANLRGLVEEALETLPALADRFEIIVVNDGSRDETPAIADALAAAHPEVRAVHHPTNLGYGAALRSGFAAARYESLAFTDGDRQFKVADLGRLIDRYAAGDTDAVVGKAFIGTEGHADEVREAIIVCRDEFGGGPGGGEGKSGNGQEAAGGVSEISHLHGGLDSGFRV